MARLFFADIPEGPTCASCGKSAPKVYDEYTGEEFCGTDCFVEWFLENRAEELAAEEAHECLRDKE